MKNRSNMLHAKSCESNLENDISDTRLIDYLDSENKYIFVASGICAMCWEMEHPNMVKQLIIYTHFFG